MMPGKKVEAIRALREEMGSRVSDLEPARRLWAAGKTERPSIGSLPRPRATTRALRSVGPAGTSGTSTPRRSRIIVRASRASSIPFCPTKALNAAVDAVRK